MLVQISARRKRTRSPSGCSRSFFPSADFPLCQIAVFSAPGRPYNPPPPPRPSAAAAAAGAAVEVAAAVAGSAAATAAAVGADLVRRRVRQGRLCRCCR